LYATGVLLLIVGGGLYASVDSIVQVGLMQEEQGRPQRTWF
jgi:hypothetical protein